MGKTGKIPSVTFETFQSIKRPVTKIKSRGGVPLENNNRDNRDNTYIHVHHCPDECPSLRMKMGMNLTGRMGFRYMIIGMVVCSFLVQYFVMSWIMTAKPPEFIRNSLGKFYAAMMMASMMGLLEALLHVTQMHGVHLVAWGNGWWWILLFTVMTVVSVGLYRRQVGINDKQYLHEMVEHHAMAILTSGEILQTSTNEKVRELASNIIKNQTKEITEMDALSSES